MYHFDEQIDRSGTNCVKWSPEYLEEQFGERDMLPFWIADMDFRVAKEIEEAIQKCAAHGIFGYSNSDEPKKAYVDWAQRRFHWQVSLEEIVTTPGVVPALNLAVQTFTQPGEKVMIQQPVYYPFEHAIENNERIVSCNELIYENNQYRIDFEDFERRAKDPKTKMFILCSPHNPVGKVWDKEDLMRMAEICLENDVFVVCDEIHNDLVFSGNQHHVFASLGEKYAQNAMICVAPSKTFNLAGLQYSMIVIPNQERRDRFSKQLEKLSIGAPNPFGIVAAEAAYRSGEVWLEELLTYLEGNEAFLREYLQKHLPKVRIPVHQATYMIWLDFNAFGLSDEELETLIFHKAKVALDGGSWFGKGGNGFMRMNIACPRSLLEEGLEKIVKVFE